MKIVNDVCKISKTRPRVLVSGPYGGLNLGDDAIGKIICLELEKRGFDVVLAARVPTKARELVAKVPVVDQLDIRNGRISVIKAIRECDGVLIGGGEQLYEPRLPNPIWGLLATNVQMKLIAGYFKKKFALVGVGVDSDISTVGRIAVKWSFSKANFIGVRDIDSQRLLTNWMGGKRDIFLGADPVFLMKPVIKNEAKQFLETEYGIPSSSPTVLIMPSNDKIHSNVYLTKLNETVKLLTKTGVYVFYAISDLQTSYDLELCRDGMLFINEKTFWITPGEGGIEGLNTVIAAADCLVSSRMHPLIFSLVQRTPFVCLARSAKMHALMTMLGINDYFDIDEFNVEELKAAVENRLKQGVSGYYAPLQEPLAALKKRAEIQFDHLAKCFY